ncbi:MAG TPA: 50S ribosomal protein L11 methyltransferase, partial [Clostridia bacterium]|nr:50S ribosomal protein L11 methyltransferase [Clostridia bacterium]
MPLNRSSHRGLFSLEEDLEYLIIKVKSKNAEKLEEELSFYKIDGLEILNPQDRMYYESSWQEDEAPDQPLGEEAVLKIYGEKKELQNIVHSYRDIILLHSYEKNEDKDWNALWALQFKGIKQGDIFVRPPWIDKKENYIDLIIEPGMGFGTGSHETTLLSLGALRDYLKPKAYVYDVGTGSGILAILAKKLEASFVHAIEIDEMALKNARVNAELNNLDIYFSQGDLLSNCQYRADLIVANILPPILKRMKDDAYNLLNPGGILLLSGILDKRVEEVLEVYGRDFILKENRSMGQWHVLILEK